MTRARLLKLTTAAVIALAIVVLGPRSPEPVNAQRGAAPEGWTQVVRLIDGDTVDVGGGYRVRLFGINAPELNQRCGRDATETLRALLTDHGRDYWVYLEYGPRTVDDFGRALGYLWVNDGGDAWYMVDEWMAYLGAANAWTADGQYRERIVAAERDARANRRGCLWAGGGAVPAPPPVTTTQAPPSGNCHPSYPTLCLPLPPPDLDCADVGARRFPVRPPDPHRLDGDGDGIGCE